MNQLQPTTIRSACIRVNDASVYYEDTGGTGEPILFSHALLLNRTLFAPQVDALRHQFRCVAYDHRGQGKSTDERKVPEIDMDTLCNDVVALIETLRLGPVHFCGVSMGGFVGMRLAARHPDLVRSLILLSTSADPEPQENKGKYKLLNFFARWFGPRCVADAVAPIVYGKTALNDPARRTEQHAWRQHLRRNPRSIYRAVNGVINRAGVYEELHKIVAPTLVLVGEEDVATVPAHAERLSSAIAGARLLRIPNAGHSIPVEQPAVVSSAIRSFIETREA